MNAQITTGRGEAADFVAMVETELTEALGFRPYYGTLNLDGLDGVDSLPSSSVPDVGDEHCDGVRLRPCRVAGIRAAVIRPFVPGYPDSKVEVLAPVRLRTVFDLEVGDPVPVTAPGEAWLKSGPSADPTSLDRFDAVVFDLDGTLVDLDVDWSAAREDVEAVLGRFAESTSERDANEIFRTARRYGRYDDLATVLESYERDGAEGATPVQPRRVVTDLDCPVGVCTANAGSAARRALERFGMLDAVDAIVSRESTVEQKPRPEPLEKCLRALDVAPGNAVFVGDERSDATAAVRSGTSFLRSTHLLEGDR